MNFYKLYHGDCLDITSTLDAECVNSAILDPPYNIGIADWDKIDNYIPWLKTRLIETQRVLKNNGTMWFFHNNFITLTKIQNMIEKETDFKFKQFITINKGVQSIVGRTSDKLRSYPTATEYLLFYTFEDLTGSEQLSEKYSRINPMAKYLQSEFERAKVNNKEISKLFPSKTGGLTGCVSNWIQGLNFPQEWQYNKIREYLNKEKDYEYLRQDYEDLRQDYEDLRQDYEDLRQDYEDLRYTFNLQNGITDVWDIDFYKDRIPWHPTSKPVELIKRIIKTSTNKDDIIFDPFLGSGATLKAAQDTSRSCIGIELNHKYIKKIKQRCWGRQFLDRQVEYDFIPQLSINTKQLRIENGSSKP